MGQIGHVSDRGMIGSDTGAQALRAHSCERQINVSAQGEQSIFELNWPPSGILGCDKVRQNQ